MTVEITRDHNTQTFTGIANEEGSVFRCAAEEIKALGETNQVPSEFLLKVQDVPGRVVFEVARRGTWIDENGMERPALHVTGSGWIGGQEGTGYLLVFRVAYRHQKDVHLWTPACSDYSGKRIRPYDAVFAHKGRDLVNDEIIVYDEAQSAPWALLEMAPA